jgi:glutamate-1-semialdehyde 2,1-aminomutase
LAALADLDATAYERLAATAARLADGMREAFTGAGLPVVVPRVGPLVGLFFGETAPRDFDDADALARNGRYAPVFHALLEQGVALAPGPYEAIFPSLAHTDADVDETIEACAIAAAKVVNSR